MRCLDLMKEWNVLERAARNSTVFQQRLEGFSDHPLVGETRGVGLIGAIEMVSDKSSKQGFSSPGKVGGYCAQMCLEQGLIVRPLGDSIAFCPPLIISRDEIEEMFVRFSVALDATAKWVRESNN